MNNRRTKDAAIRQVNFARIGSLAHNDGKRLGTDSLEYLFMLEDEVGKWLTEINKEVRRVQDIEARHLLHLSAGRRRER